MWAGDCLDKRGQRIETQFKVRKDCCDKTHLALMCSAALVMALYQKYVESSLLLSISVTVAEQRCNVFLRHKNNICCFLYDPVPHRFNRIVRASSTCGCVALKRMTLSPNQWSTTEKEARVLLNLHVYLVLFYVVVNQTWFHYIFFQCMSIFK